MFFSKRAIGCDIEGKDSSPIDRTTAIQVMASITRIGTGITRPLTGTVRCKRFFYGFRVNPKRLPYSPRVIYCQNCTIGHFHNFVGKLKKILL